ncbi:hypothetical protein HPF_02430 [Hydrogenophaga pseudoflava]|uniref:Uncharacterized protein n=1 Tax=Hydrogenophaga pseudoflava TaxID=47421 RepID=A0A4P6WT70_HYDPS|nr:hypothetical protein HPF_02430 [Hydrogenophaga pseudoflava]
MPQGHPILAEFQRALQAHYTCYIMATMGMNSARAVYANAAPSNRVFIGPRDPSKHRKRAVIPPLKGLV